MVLQITSDALNLTLIIIFDRLSALPAIMSRANEVLSFNKLVVMTLSKFDFTTHMIKVSTSANRTLPE